MASLTSQAEKKMAVSGVASGVAFGVDSGVASGVASGAASAETAAAPAAATTAAALAQQRADEKEKADRAAKKMEAVARGRQTFEYNGRTVYEWDQSLEEVGLYIRPPPGITARGIACTITATHLSLGLKGADKPFIDEDFFSKVKVDESDWMMSDGEIEINCQKMNKAQTWESALLGHGQMNAYVKGEVQKALMLERFGAENPGFE